MHVVFKGSISAVLASDPNEAKELAERLGKRTENNIYYRRIGDLIRSVLVPEALSDQAEALSLSTAFYLKVSKFDATTAELALLAEASGLKGIVMTHDRENFMRYFGDLGSPRCFLTFRNGRGRERPGLRLRRQGVQR
jgi:hypothetical protein